MRALIIFTIYLYQKTLSPQTGWLKIFYFSPILSLTPGYSGCRHAVTCSQYAIEQCRNERSLFVAVNRSARRILSCHF